MDDVVPFWVKNSPDYEHGGYFTCLTSEGKVFDTDKFVWLQGKNTFVIQSDNFKLAREVWMFSKLYNVISDDQVSYSSRNVYVRRLEH